MMTLVRTLLALLIAAAASASLGSCDALKLKVKVNSSSKANAPIETSKLPGSGTVANMAALAAAEEEFYGESESSEEHNN